MRACLALDLMPVRGTGKFTFLFMRWVSHRVMPCSMVVAMGRVSTEIDAETAPVCLVRVMTIEGCSDGGQEEINGRQWPVVDFFC